MPYLAVCFALIASALAFSSLSSTPAPAGTAPGVMLLASDDRAYGKWEDDDEDDEDDLYDDRDDDDDDDDYDDAAEGRDDDDDWDDRAPRHVRA